MLIQPVQVFSEGSSKAPSNSNFKALKPAEVAALSEQQRKEYIARRIEVQKVRGPGALCETSCRCFVDIDEVAE